MHPITADTHCYIAVRPATPDTALMISTLEIGSTEMAIEIAQRVMEGFVIRCVPIEEGRIAILKGFDLLIQSNNPSTP